MVTFFARLFSKATHHIGALVIIGTLCTPRVLAQWPTFTSGRDSVANNSTLYLTPKAAGSSPGMSYPQLTIANRQHSSSGDCTTIQYQVQIVYRGKGWGRSPKTPVTNPDPNPVEPDDTILDSVESPTASGYVNCGQEQSLDWTVMGAIYGGILNLYWAAEDDVTGGYINSGTLTVKMYAYNPSNSSVNSEIASLLSGTTLPAGYYERMLVVESGTGIQPVGQYHQFWHEGSTLAGTGGGLPVDSCSCPEGVGLVQIDNTYRTHYHTDGEPPNKFHTISFIEPIDDPGVFWDWADNLTQGKTRVTAALSGGKKYFDRYSQKAIQNGAASAPDPITTGACTFSGVSGFELANGMAAYNGGVVTPFYSFVCASGSCAWVQGDGGHTVSGYKYVTNACGKTPFS